MNAGYRIKATGLPHIAWRSSCADLRLQQAARRDLVADQRKKLEAVVANEVAARLCAVRAVPVATRRFLMVSCCSRRTMPIAWCANASPSATIFQPVTVG